ncbi:N-acetyltransferase [Bacillus sp. JCM 19041]|uniref:N-acetyltransferase n=1 Tax=Bacillus sp. JCM 19041 TaxID=1460637 RepID=UPI0006CF2E08
MIDIIKAITKQQKVLGATEQWVSVQKDNEKGIPFYEAKGFLFKQEVQSYESQKPDRACVFALQKTDLIFS